MADVMLVEDDETIGRNVHAALVDARYRVLWCRDGASAIAAAARGAASIWSSWISDYRMSTESMCAGRCGHRDPRQ